MQDLKDLQKLLLKTAVQMPEVGIKVIKVEGINFIKHNFRKVTRKLVSVRKYFTFEISNQSDKFSRLKV